MREGGLWKLKFPGRQADVPHRAHHRFLLGLVVSLIPACVAFAQQFHPAMVEVGYVEANGSVKFDPPFPNPPTVVLSVKRTQKLMSRYEDCTPTATNVNTSNCNTFPKSQYPSTWIAILLQP